MGGRKYELYTGFYYIFNWYHWIFSIGINIDIFLYTHICFYICMLTLQIVSISIGIHFFIHMYFICAYYISISLSTNFGYAKLDFLNDYYISIDYVSIGILYKLMHHFVWYFIKGEKIHILLFNWFCLPLVFYSHTLCWKMILIFLVSFALNENYFQLVYVSLFSIGIYFIFNIGIKNIKLILFSIWYLYCKMSFVFKPKRLVYDFRIGIKSVKYFQLVLIFTIGIKITYMFISFIDIKILLVSSKCFVYFQLVS